MKNAQNEDPCRRSATSLISGDTRKSSIKKKVSILRGRGDQNWEIHIFHIKAYIEGCCEKL